MSDWAQFRSEIPALKNHTYLMSAAAGPLHPRAFEAAKKFSEELRDHGDVNVESIAEEIEKTRERAARLLSVQSKEICFLPSSSMAMNVFSTIVKSHTNKDKMSVLSMRDEFPSSSLPWRHQGFDLRWVESEGGAYPLQNIQKVSIEGVSTLVSSHVQYSTGYRQNMTELASWARSQNLFLAVNATQSLGAFPVNAAKVDFLCASIHKWLMSGYGLSVTMISEKFLKRDLPFHGWFSERDPWAMKNEDPCPVREARALEVGCAPFHQILCLGAVLQWIEELGGVSKISQRILSLAAHAKEELRKNGIPLLYDFSEDQSSGIILVSATHPKEMVEELIKRNVHVSARGLGVRLALHAFNDESDIHKFIEAYRKIV